MFVGILVRIHSKYILPIFEQKNPALYLFYSLMPAISLFRLFWLSDAYEYFSAGCQCLIERTNNGTDVNVLWSQNSKFRRIFLLSVK